MISINPSTPPTPTPEEKGTGDEGYWRRRVIGVKGPVGDPLVALSMS